MKKLLIIAGIYPPKNHIASRRIAGFVKYLPENGWEPFVITRDWSHTDVYDPDYKDERIEQAVVKRIKAGGNNPGNSTFFDHVRSWKEGMKNPHIWTEGAIKTAEELFKKENIDVIFATYPQASNLYIGQYLGKKYQIPWIADMRDIAGEAIASIKNPLQYFTVFRQIQWEKELVKSATEIISVNRGSLYNILEKRAQIQPVLLYNGFDPDYFYPNHETKKIAKTFEMVYTGSIHLNENFRLINDALCQLITNNKIKSEDIVLKFIGTQQNRISDSFTDQKILSRIQQVRWSPATTVSDYQKNSTILLHATNPKIPGWITGKLVEYLGAHRPILSVPGDETGADIILRNTKAGYSCPSIESAKEVILALYTEWKQTGYVKFKGIEEEIKKYSYPYLTRKLAEVLDETAEGKKS